MRQPLLILVSGAPGAGKTTLAGKLAHYLRIPHIPRDEIMRGLEMTEGGPINKGEQGIKVYYGLLEHMLEAGISFVTDGTIYKGISETDIKSRLTPRAVVVNVHVRAKNEHQRFIDREKRREGWSHEWVQGHINRLEEIYHQTVDPLDLGVPLVEVRADDEYEPSLNEIARQLHLFYNDTRPGAVYQGD